MDHALLTGNTRCCQVRKDAARPRKLQALSAAREAAYARYANIYKDHAAETYARCVAAAKSQQGGVEAYRRRIVAASLDAERYKGYHDTEVATAEQEEEGQADMSVGDSTSLSVSISETSGSEADVRQGGGASNDAVYLLGNDAESECTAVSSGGGSEAFLGPGTARHAEEWGTAMTSGRGGSTFVDVVPFHNVRAKYMRPWNDTALSRPYQVRPSPSWRVGGAVRLGSVSTAASGLSLPTTAESGRTMEGHHKTVDTATRRRSYTLTGKAGKAWGQA